LATPSATGFGDTETETLDWPVLVVTFRVAGVDVDPWKEGSPE
jgi:hypothetical protein